MPPLKNQSIVILFTDVPS